MFKKLIKILNFNSVTPDSTGCQKYIGNLFKKIGFQIFTLNYKKTCNSIFVRYFKNKNKKIDLVFLGHTDVVPFKEKIFLSKEKIFCRGIVDMKGSIFCFYKTISFLIKKEMVNKTVAVLLSGDEEGNSIYGIKELIKRIKNKIKIKNCLIGEPTSSKKIGDFVKTQRRGSYNFKIILKGKKKHNAYYNNNLFLKIKFFLYFFKKNKINMFNIKSNNNKTNIIPSKIIIYLNYRYKKKKDLIFIHKNIKKIFIKNKIKGHIIEIQNSKPYRSKKKSFLNNIKKKIKTKLKNNKGGTSDGRFIKKISKNIVEIGLRNKYAHRDNENARIADIFSLIILYLKIVS